MTTHTPPHIQLDDFWPYQVVVLADQISRYTLSVVREKSELNLSQWRVLAAVADKPGRSAAEVTAVTPMDKTIVSRAVASLIKTELIEKAPTTHDKRRLSLTTTPAGHQIYNEISRELNAKLTGWSAQHPVQQNFTEMLKNYSERLEKVTPQT